MLLRSLGLRKGARASATPFTPSDVADLRLWLDADDASTITESSGAVSQWADKSGNGLHVAQGTGANQPTTGTRTVNGRNVVDFDGGDFLFRSGVASLMDGECTIFTVWQADATGNIGGIIDHHDTATNSSMRTVSYADMRSSPFRHSGRQKTDVGGSAILLDHPAALSSGTPYQQTTVIESDHTATAYEGGTQVDTATLETVSWQDQPDTLTVGRQAVGPLWHDGPICELLVYTRALTTSERQAVEDYLIDKWGIV